MRRMAEEPLKRLDPIPRPSSILPASIYSLRRWVIHHPLLYRLPGSCPLKHAPHTQNIGGGLFGWQTRVTAAGITVPHCLSFLSSYYGQVLRRATDTAWRRDQVLAWQQKLQASRGHWIYHNLTTKSPCWRSTTVVKRLSRVSFVRTIQEVLAGYTALNDGLQGNQESEDFDPVFIAAKESDYDDIVSI